MVFSMGKPLYSHTFYHLHTVGVAGSKPAARTILIYQGFHGFKG